MSDLTRTVQQWRQRLLQREAAAQRDLAAAHAATLRTLQPQLDQITNAIAAAQASGTPVSVSWLLERNRLVGIEAAITDHLDAYGVTSLGITRHAIEDTGLLGVDAGMLQLQASVPAGVAWSFSRPNPAAIEQAIGATHSGSPVASLFSSFGGDASSAARSALITGVSLGQAPSVIARTLTDVLTVPRWRAQTIARTETLRSYRGAQHASMQANRDVVDGWIWTASLSVNSCAACIAMSGTVHKLSETLDAHPNCRCVETPLTRDWSEILDSIGLDGSDIEDTRPNPTLGTDWFDAQSADDQRRILGPARYAALQNGDVSSLTDFVGTTYDRTWGASVTVQSLKDLGLDAHDYR